MSRGSSCRRTMSLREANMFRRPSSNGNIRREAERGESDSAAYGRACRGKDNAMKSSRTLRYMREGEAKKKETFRREARGVF